MIIYLATITYCSLLYFMINHLPDYGIVLTQLTLISLTLGIAFLALEQINARNHPLRKKITDAILKWRKSNGTKKTSKNIVLLNLSGKEIDLSFNPFLVQILSIRYGECHLTGYAHQEGAFFLSISHPNNDMDQLQSLWQAISQSQIKFTSLQLILDPNQLPQITENLQTEWLPLKRILLQASEVHLTLSNHALLQNIYYLSAFGSPTPIISLNPGEMINKTLQNVNAQLNKIIESSFIQRNEICSQPPVSNEQKKDLLSLTLYLTKIKDSILEASCELISNHIKLQHIHVGTQITNKLPHENNIHHYYRFLRYITMPLTILTCSLYIIQFSINKTLHQKINSLAGPQMVFQLKQLEHYPQYHSLQQTHLKNLLEHHLDRLNSSHKELLKTLMSHSDKTSSDFKHWVLEQIVPEVHDPDLKDFLISKWFQYNHTNIPPSIDEISEYINPKFSYEICRSISPDSPKNCTQVVNEHLKYQEYDGQLNQMLQTLVPLNQNDLEQSIRQLGYMSKHPKNTGKETLRHLEHLIFSLEQNEAFSPLLEKANQLKETINLMHTPEGAFILSQLQKIYQHAHLVSDDDDIIKLFQSAYATEDHPVRHISSLKRMLNPFQAKWLSELVDPILQPLTEQANHIIQSEWEQNIEPLLQHLSNQYPFNAKSEVEAKPPELYALFGNDQALDQFHDQYLQPFLIESDGELPRISDVNLGINISENALYAVIYQHVLLSSIDLSSNNLHSSWAINLSDYSHPVESVTLHTNNQTFSLPKKKSSSLHWNSSYPVGLDIKLQSGETITISQDGYWSIARLFMQFDKNSAYQYQYIDPSHSWHITLDITPQYKIDLLEAYNVLTDLPGAKWRTH